jgi:RNA polymerase sigma-70 factor (ECF subfamily)
MTQLVRSRPVVSAAVSDAELRGGRQLGVKTDLPNGQWSDEDLFEEYRLTGRDELFSELVKRFEGELFAYLFRYLGDRGMAEDVFQATFLQLHLKRSSYHRGRKLRPWLYRIATNQAIDALRRSRRHRRRVPGGERHGESDAQKWLETFPDVRGRDPTAANDENETRWLRGAIESLPPHLRSPLILVYFQGLKYREAAEILSLPLGTLKSRMFAALLRLRELSQSSHLAPRDVLPGAASNR